MITTRDKRPPSRSACTHRLSSPCAGLLAGMRDHERAKRSTQRSPPVPRGQPCGSPCAGSPACGPACRLRHRAWPWEWHIFCLSYGLGPFVREVYAHAVGRGCQGGLMASPSPGRDKRHRRDPAWRYQGTRARTAPVRWPPAHPGPHAWKGCMSTLTDWQLGATSLGEQRCRFLLWAPHSDTVDVHIVAPQEQWVPLTPGVRGYHHTVAAGVPPGSLYCYRLNGRGTTRSGVPLAAARRAWASQVMDLTFAWDDGAWHGLPWSHYVLYELHVGTYRGGHF